MAEARTIDPMSTKPVVPGIVRGLTCIAARSTIELDLPARIRLVIALVPVLPFMLALDGSVRGIRSMDEPWRAWKRYL